MMQNVMVIIVSFFIATSSFAVDLGCYGVVKEIVEQNPIVFFQQKAKEMEQNGMLEKIQQQMRTKAKERIIRPKPVAWIQNTSMPREYLVDRDVILQEDIVDYDGNIIFAKGTKVNPLTYRTSKKALIFINGDDENQVVWAIAEHQRRQGYVKLTLINGSPVELSKKYSVRFFFDQGGSLVREFEIEQVPAIVSQMGAQLLVQEIKL